MDLLVADPVLLAGFDLFGLDRAGGVADVGLAGAELFEAAAGAGGADRHPDAGVFGLNCSATASVSGATVLEPSMRIDAGEVAAAAAAGRTVVVAAAAGGDRRAPGRQQGDE